MGVDVVIQDIDLVECRRRAIGPATFDEVVIRTGEGSTVSMFFGFGLGQQVAAAISAAARGRVETLPVTAHGWPVRPDMAHIEGAEGGR